jgi:acyl-CoA thioester hydrolase
MKTISKYKIIYADTDKMQVVYHARYFEIYERARTDFMEKFGISNIELESDGYLVPLMESGIKYIRAAKYGDISETHTTIEFPSPLKMKFNYKIFVDGILINEGFTIHTFTDEKLKPVRPPKRINEIKMRFKEDGKRD